MDCNKLVKPPEVNYLYLFIFFICFLLQGCAGVETSGPTLLETGVPQRLDQEAVLLPLLDSRKFPDPEKPPNLDEGIPVLMPAETVNELSRQVLIREGLFRNLRSYQGPLPTGPVSGWTDLPLRGLRTDLGIGLELRRLELKRTGLNNLFVPHALLDSVLLPFFTGGVLATNGHTDLAARVIPSAKVRFSLALDLNAVSLSGGGLFFTKTYQMNLTDPAVSESTLYSGFFRSPDDGQTYGLEAAPTVIENALTMIARDPELAYLPRYAQIAWAGRVLADDRLEPLVKKRLIEEAGRDLVGPEASEKEFRVLAASHLTLPEKIETILNLDQNEPEPWPGGEFLRMYSVDPGWIERERAKARGFKLYYQLLLQAAGRLGREKIKRPLTAAEKTLEETVLKSLGRLERTSFGNTLFRLDLRNENLGLAEKRALFLLLARDLETLDNETFIEQEVQARIEALSSGSDQDQLEAAAFLVDLMGPKAVEEYPISRGLLFKVLTPDDHWAAPLVLEALYAGDFQPEVLRAAGRLQLTEALPLLFSGLDSGQPWLFQTLETKDQPDIPLLPAGPKTKKTTAGPDRALIAETLGCFPDQPEVIAVLRSLLARSGTHGEVEPELAAAAVRSLSHLGDVESVGVILSLCLGEKHEGSPPPVIRSAGLEALAVLAGPDAWAGIFEAAKNQTADLSQNLAFIREAADFFGRVRFAPAVSWLGEIIRHPQSTETLRQAAYRALSLIATDRAEAELTALAGGISREQAQAAAQALDQLALERAFRQRLERS